ncbi:GcrA family cell cycle regulator [Martelella sp. AD-3]|uniref:GcrA family cell cycle regulator n=1 Tax=Martelella sp. AD-3 TaxID=686597 RepID=UPI0009E04898|nr:GcrA family cell cycle regulator [Martelella sp. AD-3]
MSDWSSKEAAPAPRMISLLELDDAVCRWPVTEAGENTGFCGHATGGKPPYCPYHRDKAHGEGTSAEQAALKNLKRIMHR